jgi:8-oxo-dGTP diphosphatase
MKVRSAVIIIKNDALLTLQYTYSQTKVFMLPGGNVDYCETLENCAIRELSEEIAAEIIVEKLAFIAEVHQETDIKLHCVFEATLLNDSLTINKDQTSAEKIVWLPLAEVSTVALYPNISEAILKRFVQKTQPEEVFLGTIQQPFY